MKFSANPAKPPAANPSRKPDRPPFMSLFTASDIEFLEATLSPSEIQEATPFPFSGEMCSLVLASLIAGKYVVTKLALLLNYILDSKADPRLLRSSLELRNPWLYAYRNIARVSRVADLL